MHKTKRMWLKSALVATALFIAVVLVCTSPTKSIHNVDSQISPAESVSNIINEPVATPSAEPTEQPVVQSEWVVLDTKPIEFSSTQQHNKEQIIWKGLDLKESAQTENHAKKAANIQAKLLPLRAEVDPPNESLPHDVMVPAKAMSLYYDLKRTIFAHIQSKLNDKEANQENETNDPIRTPSTIAPNILWTTLQANKLVRFDSAPNLPYDHGVISQLEAKYWILNDTHYVTVLLGLSIPCSVDTALALYEKNSKKWVLKMILSADNYRSITRAQMSLDHELFLDNDKHVMVATAHGSPWCTSAWRGNHMRLLTPGDHPEKPKVLFSAAESARHDYEFTALIKTENNSVSFDFLSWANVGNRTVRQHHWQITKTAKGYERTAPWVVQPEDLPDVWLTTTWEKAQSFSNPLDSPKLQTIHRELTQKGVSLHKCARTKRVLSEERFEIKGCGENKQQVRFEIIFAAQKTQNGWVIDDAMIVKELPDLLLCPPPLLSSFLLCQRAAGTFVPPGRVDSILVLDKLNKRSN